nr:hypothetical protein [Tanacetum cinerariifolium]
MMKRVDFFVKSEEAFKSTELPKGEQSEKGHEVPYKGFRPPRAIHGGGPPRGEGYNAHNRRDHYLPYVPPRQMGRRYENRRFEHRRQEVNQLSLESLVKRPKEILATELQLQLPHHSTLVETPKKENMDRYCDYHGEKGHYTNDCFHLKRQLEIALGSEKLNHLVKDVRQRGGNRERQGGNGNTHGKIINMVHEMGKNQKRKCQGRWEEDWMSAPITFPSISFNDVSDELLIVEVEIEGYLARLSRTHTKLVGFSGEQLRPMGKIELEVVFGNEGLSRRTMMKFIVVEASSPYNIILGRTRIRELRAVSSTIHAMTKFPTLRGIATLVPRRDAIFECRQIEVRQASPEEPPEEKIEKKKESPTEDVIINPAFPDQKITIGTQFSPATKVEDARPGKKQSSDEGSEGIAQSGDSKAGTVPHVDIKPGPSKKEDDVLHRSRHLLLYQNAIWPKNARTTYQGLVDSAFQTQLGRNLVAYVHDMVIKSHTKEDMIMDVMETFDNLKKINMKLNPKRCSFGVKEGKFLGYMVTSEGIRDNPKKTNAVADMQSSKTLKEMQSLSGKLASLNRFLSRSAERTMPFFDTLKNITKENKDDFHWTEAAEQAFQELKTVIMELPTLTTLNLKETLYVCLAASREAVKASGKLAKYAVELGAYNIAYMPQNAIKGQVLADFLTEVPMGTGNAEVCSLANNTKVEKWTLFTNGASSLKGAGAGLVLIDPTGTEYTYAIRLNFTSTNNEAEYEALLAKLRITGKMKAPSLIVKVDSKLVACQMNGEFVASSDGMAKYLMKAKELSAGFEEFSIKNVPRNQNQKADVLSKLASVAFNHLTKEILVEVLNAKSVEVQEVNAIVEKEENNWMTPIIKCIEEGIWPVDENEARTMRMKIGKYVMEEGILFKNSYLSPMLRCVGLLQANYIIREIHKGACGMHARARSIVAKIIRHGYYWPSMHRDTKEVVDRCDSCQIHGPVPNLPKTKLTSFMSPFGVLRVIVTDNGTQLVNDPFKSWCEKWKIKQMNTSVPHPQANGLVERANKSLMHGLKARLVERSTKRRRNVAKSGPHSRKKRDSGDSGSKIQKENGTIVQQASPPGIIQGWRLLVPQERS